MHKRILFITQDMNRTGSEMVLWHLLNNLDATKYSIFVFCLRKGTLYHFLPTHVSKSVVYKASGLLRNKIWRVILKTMGKDLLAYQLKTIHQKFKPDYWYVNTLAIPWVYRVADKINVKVVTHLHELLYAFSFNKAKEFETMLTRSKTIIGCSDIVCEHISNLGHKDVRLQYSFIDEEDIRVDEEEVGLLKKQLGIMPGDFIWVISGATAYMKGFDYILDLLQEFSTQPHIKFLWIGRQFDDGLNYYIENIAKSKFANKLIFVGAQSDNYFNYVAIGNGQLVLSREETFCMVAVEAAVLGIPTVGFDVGILKAFVEEDMGEIVESGNIKALIAAMHRWHAIKTPNSFKLKQKALDYSVKTQIVKFEQILQEL